MNYQPSIFDGTEQSMLNKSLELIKGFEDVALKRNPLGYIVGYSGGKDSDVLVNLFMRSGVKFCVIHNHTTLDVPETVYYVRRKFAEWQAGGVSCKIYYPRKSFWQLCLDKGMLPTRIARFCCEELKERKIIELHGAVHSFGVRKAESVKRAANRDSIETRNRADYSDFQKFHFDNSDEVRLSGACYTNNYFYVNPLAYWTDEYLWNYIESEHIEVNPLYKCGFSRIGCIGCPMARKHRIFEFEHYPKYKDRFIKLCDDLIKKRTEQGLQNTMGFKDGQEYFEWWLCG